MPQTTPAREAADAAANWPWRTAAVDLSVSVDQDAIFESGMKAWLRDQRKESLEHFERLAKLSAGEAIGAFDLLFWSRLDETRPEAGEGAAFLEGYLSDAKPDAFNRALALQLLAQRRRQMGDAAGAEEALDRAGVLRNWTMIGPLPQNADLCADSELQLAALDFQSDYVESHFRSAWRDLGETARFGELHPARYANYATGACALAATRIVSGEETAAALRVAHAGRIAIWANGKRLRVEDAGDGRRYMETAVAPILLQKGDNLILIATEASAAEADWRATVRLTDPAGEPIEAEAFSDPKSFSDRNSGDAPKNGPEQKADFFCEKPPVGRLSEAVRSMGGGPNAHAAFAFADLALGFDGDLSEKARTAANDALDGKGVDAALYLQLHTVEKNPNLAVRLLDLANEIDGDCVRCRAAQAKIFYEDFGLDRKAQSLLSRALESNPDSGAALGLQFDISLSQGDLERAWKSLQKLEASEIAGAAPRRRELTEGGDLPGGRAESARLLAAELERDPLDAERIVQWADLSVEAASTPKAFEAIRGALSRYEALNPDHGEIRLAVAWTWRAQGELEKEIESLKETGDIYAHNADIQELLGVRLFEAKRYEEAQAAFERALQLNDRLSIAKATLARIDEIKRENEAK